MNDLQNIPSNITTMSSREIAELCEKQHKNVLRDIEVMFEALSLDRLTFERIYTDKQGREQREYHLNKDLTMTLVTGYSILLRNRVVVRLNELEQSGGVSRHEFETLKAAVENGFSQIKKDIWASAIRTTESLGADFKQKPYTKGKPKRLDYKRGTPEQLERWDQLQDPQTVVGDAYEPSDDDSTPWN
ncbi:Rha family transcriptional regulator [Maritalea porphyrae]|uniref:Rha family transcriptional regulator n=1 Tax=Maritalea porphyrae TaxID=880732 RepID=UPI0022AFB4B4|nr:Rha family transcriptional regulator [Maritalea porphyrae]MCZ4270767.1 Rha family transcriptional regulator [Maritalea porphyrae]